MQCLLRDTGSNKPGMKWTLAPVTVPLLALLTSGHIDNVATPPAKSQGFTLCMSKMAKTFTKEEVAKHSSEESCWIIINKKVYDVTNWLDTVSTCGECNFETCRFYFYFLICTPID